MCNHLLRRLVCFKRDERGVQLVEFAIVLPIVIMLFAAAGEFGRYFYEYSTLAKGSRVAARYLTTADSHGNDDPCAKNLVVYGNLGGTGSPILTGLTPDNVQINRRNSAGGVITGGVIPYSVTVDIINYTHTSVLDLARMTNSSSTLAIDVKPSVTMHYLLTQPPIATAPCF